MCVCICVYISIEKNGYGAYAGYAAYAAYGASATWLAFPLGFGPLFALIRLPDRFPARVWATFRPDRFQDRLLWPQDRQLRP